jgi:hypothetical protein
MTEVQVGRGGVEAGLDAQRASGFAALFEALPQVARTDDRLRVKILAYQLKYKVRGPAI